MKSRRNLPITCIRERPGKNILILKAITFTEFNDCFVSNSLRISSTAFISNCLCDLNFWVCLLNWNRGPARGTSGSFSRTFDNSEFSSLRVWSSSCAMLWAVTVCSSSCKKGSGDSVSWFGGVLMEEQFLFNWRRW